jgi:hypothetical protein
MEAPIVLSDPNNMAGILINNLIKEEDIARQRSLLDSKMYTEMLRRSNASRSFDSEHHTLFDATTIGRYLGPRVSEFAQTTDKTVDYHVYPSGRQVIKAFIANDFQFIDVTGQVITGLNDTSIDVVDRVHVTWRIQKNRQNNQKVTLSCDKANPTICPVLATTFSAQSALPVTTGFNAGGLLPQEGCTGLSHWIQDRAPFPSRGKSCASEHIEGRRATIFRPLVESLGLRPFGRSRKIARLHKKASSLDGRLLLNVFA